MENGNQASSNRMESKPSTTSSNPQKSSRAPPNCQLCSNHKEKFPLKGHKRYCRRQDCNCIKCTKSKKRQKSMAHSTAVRRAKILDQERGIALAEGEVHPKTFNGNEDLLDSTPQSTRRLEISDDSPISNQYKNEVATDLGQACGPKSRKSRSSLPSARTMTPMPQTQTGSEFVEVLLHCSTLLLEFLQYSYTSLPLMYVILKYAGANMEEAAKRIEEARMEICMIDYLRRHRMNEYAQRYYCRGYTLSPGTIEGVPTYEGSAPYVGVVPPQCTFHLRPHPDSMSAHTTEPSSTPVSSPEATSTYPCKRIRRTRGTSICSFRWIANQQRPRLNKYMCTRRCRLAGKSIERVTQLQHSGRRRHG